MIYWLEMQPMTKPETSKTGMILRKRAAGMDE